MAKNPRPVARRAVAVCVCVCSLSLNIVRVLSLSKYCVCVIASAGSSAPNWRGELKEVIVLESGKSVGKEQSPAREKPPMTGPEARRVGYHYE